MIRYFPLPPWYPPAHRLNWLEICIQICPADKTFEEFRPTARAYDRYRAHGLNDTGITAVALASPIAFVEAECVDDSFGWRNSSTLLPIEPYFCIAGGVYIEQQYLQGPAPSPE